MSYARPPILYTVAVEQDEGCIDRELFCRRTQRVSIASIRNAEAEKSLVACPSPASPVW